MEIRSSLRRKSIIALALYLCFFIATVGSVVYLVVEPPVRQNVQQNLDLRTQLLASQIEQPLTSSVGLLQSLAGLGQIRDSDVVLAKAIPELLLTSSDMIASGGLWPKPYLHNGQWQYNSLFFNKNEEGGLDQIHSYNNPESGGYDKQQWYSSVVSEPPGTVRWTGVYIDMFTKVQMITASTPYFRDGEFAGVAAVDLSLDALFQFIRETTEQYSLGTVIRDADGKVVVEHNFDLMKDIYISQLQFGDFDWQMDVVNSKVKVSDQVFVQVTSVEGGIIPLLLVCVLAGYYLLNQYLIKPIVYIAQEIDDSKTGDIIDINYPSRDEIGHLIAKFNEKTVYLEKERVKAQASTNAKTAFLATLSHEIRTPMNGVLGTAQILLKSQLTQEQRKHLLTLYESGDHMMTLLNEILDYSKIEQGHIELENAPFAFDSILGSIDSVYRTLCVEKGLEFLIISTVPQARWYNNDIARLRQVLFNLLNNAVKFTEQGYVEVVFKEHRYEGSTQLTIEVKDSGIGIPEDALSRIFRPFEQAESSTTRRFGGSGLGLAIVKQIAEHMGGRVTVDSKESIGTTFTIELAVTPCEPELVNSTSQRKSDFSGLRVLIVEDNRTNAIIMETFMRNKGFTCTVVENGQLAVELMQYRQFDLVLMDNHMPVLDGIEAISAIRSMQNANHSVLIFGCTADVFKETQERMLNAGANHIVAKPIVESELDDALHRYAEVLYQFQPYLTQNRPTEITMDTLLMTFCMALESERLSDATTALAEIIAMHHPRAEDEFTQVAARIQDSLDKEQSPIQQDIDQLIVLLA
ncbi:hybrid sensor histidine kinase/response regulator [Vibrio sp. CAU 1672]|uniref:hybrid sensor histidine kinase/response regulator n=1 Tax=Vibrio sp. CAU 1672 TaxID=3032594 RepID=UPI0023DA8087|nr:hybrid sensor histidine kinase/response regulator [Vibrio sp. CAU 1672]MDF2153714.1 ATP-binding protein [Vibrio sp. CAU 1672]